MSVLDEMVRPGEKWVSQQDVGFTAAAVTEAGMQERPADTRLTIAAFRDQLQKELKARGQEIVLPEPSPEIVEVYNILTNNGFDVAPVVYVDREKREATYGVLETVVRPDYVGNGTQMYYDYPDDDPLAKILKEGREIGRTSKGQGINTPSWANHADPRTRFFVSWDEVHDYVAAKVISATPHLAEQVATGGIVFRVPTKKEFQDAGKRYPHLGGANSWEWLYDEAGFGGRRIGGRRDDGGLRAVGDWRSGRRNDRIAFRLQAVSPSQKFPSSTSS